MYCGVSKFVLHYLQVREYIFLTILSVCIIMFVQQMHVPYSTFLAPCALNFFRVAANFLSKFFSFKRIF